jgi:Lysyl oxidase
MRARIRWVLVRAAVLLVTALAFMPAFGGGDVRAATGDRLLPNLTPLQASDLRTEVSGSQTFLRFTTTSWNDGAGALELRPGEVDTGAGKQKVLQRIYLEGGGSTDVPINTWFQYHPSHNHIHLDDYARYDLVSAADRTVVTTGNKVTFCIIDTTRMNTRLPGAPKKAQYTTCNATRQGMSVGWGDQYRYNLAGQSLDVTGLTGDFILRITVDPSGLLLETNDLDNVSERSIRLVGGRLP